MTAPPDLVGWRVGPYVLDRLHADGHLAWVFAAHPAAGGPPVALKILKPQIAPDGRLEARFRREAEVPANLHHPNVVRILDAGQDGPHRYFAMPLYRHSLASLIVERGRIDEGTTVRIGRDVAAGLASVHEKGLVHRDVKPANVLLAADGSAVIGDFGIAQAAGAAVPGADLTLGTPQYTSPEQAQGLPLDGRSDIYSLGLTLFRAATGDVPFRSTDWFELARMHVEVDAPGVRAKAPGLSVAFERVVARCLAKRPQDRYATAGELGLALEALMPSRGR